MIKNFDDFCLWVYVIVDDLWQEMQPLFKRPGPQAACSDSEILTMALVGECRGWSIETNLLSYWRERPDLFPVIPSQSRFNRRRRNLMNAFNLMRRALLTVLDLASDSQCVIDSLPIPVVKFHLVPGSTGDWDVHGANFGKIASKKQMIFGYKLHLLVTLKGVIIDFILAPASLYDFTVGEERLTQHTQLEVFADKAFISAASPMVSSSSRRFACTPFPAATRKSNRLPIFVVCTIVFAKSLRPLMVNSPSNLQSRSIMPIPFGGYVLV